MSNYIATGGVNPFNLMSAATMLNKPPKPVVAQPGSPAVTAPIVQQTDGGSNLPLYIGAGAAVVAVGVFLFLRKKRR